MSHLITAPAVEGSRWAPGFTWAGMQEGGGHGELCNFLSVATLYKGEANVQSKELAQF